jgi:hypothetical protein
MLLYCAREGAKESLFRRYDRAGGCGRPIRPDRWTYDHAVALVNGGENREANLHTRGTTGRSAACSIRKRRPS